MATPQSATRLVARRLNQPSARFRPRSIDHVTRLSMDPRLWEQTQLQNHGPPRTRAQKSIDQKLKIVEARVLGRKFNGVTLPKYEKPSQGEGEERKTRRNFLLAALESNRTYQKIYNWSRIEHFLLWINGFPRQHYGPSAVIPDLFVRRDLHYYHLENNKIKYLFPEPDMYHSIFDVGARVSKVEDIIGYKFKNKILCIEAIKLSGMNVPVYFDGILWPVRQNKRLALMGDRTLNMALCEMWYESGNSNSQYALMSSQVVARSALYATGKPLGFDESCFLMPPGSFKASQDQIAETFEAVVGAVYLDTGKQYDEVYKLIHRLGLDRHEALKTPEELEEEERLRVLGRRAKRRERREARKMEEAQTSVWQRLRELWSGKQGMHEGKDREKKGLKREEARLGVLERRAEKIEHGEMREEAGKTEAPTSVWQRLRKSWIGKQGMYEAKDREEQARREKVEEKQEKMKMEQEKIKEEKEKIKTQQDENVPEKEVQKKGVEKDVREETEKGVLEEAQKEAQEDKSEQRKRDTEALDENNVAQKSEVKEDTHEKKRMPQEKKVAPKSEGTVETKQKEKKVARKSEGEAETKQKEKKVASKSEGEVETKQKEKIVAPKSAGIKGADQEKKKNPREQVVVHKGEPKVNGNEESGAQKGMPKLATDKERGVQPQQVTVTHECGETKIREVAPRKVEERKSDKVEQKDVQAQNEESEGGKNVQAQNEKSEGEKNVQAKVTTRFLIRKTSIKPQPVSQEELDMMMQERVQEVKETKRKHGVKPDNIKAHKKLAEANVEGADAVDVGHIAGSEDMKVSPTHLTAKQIKRVQWRERKRSNRAKLRQEKAILRKAEAKQAAVQEVEALVEMMHMSELENAPTEPVTIFRDQLVPTRIKADQRKQVRSGTDSVDTTTEQPNVSEENLATNSGMKTSINSTDAAAPELDPERIEKSDHNKTVGKDTIVEPESEKTEEPVAIQHDIAGAEINLQIDNESDIQTRTERSEGQQKWFNSGMPRLPNSDHFNSTENTKVVRPASELRIIEGAQAVIEVEHASQNVVHTFDLTKSDIVTQVEDVDVAATGDMEDMSESYGIEEMDTVASKSASGSDGAIETGFTNEVESINTTTISPTDTASDSNSTNNGKPTSITSASDMDVIKDSSSSNSVKPTSTISTIETDATNTPGSTDEALPTFSSVFESGLSTFEASNEVAVGSTETESANNLLENHRSATKDGTDVAKSSRTIDNVNLIPAFLALKDTAKDKRAEVGSSNVTNLTGHE